MTQPNFSIPGDKTDKPSAGKPLWLAAAIILGVVFSPALIAWVVNLLH